MKFLTEVRRKILHLAAIVIPIGYYLLPEPIGKKLLILLTVLAIVVDIVRLNEPRVRTIFYYFFGRLIRDHERTNLLGSSYVMLACLIGAFAFDGPDRPIAIASMAFLSFGDGLAAIVGRRFGRTPLFGKTLEGSLACFAACLALALLYPGDPFAWRVMLGGAAVATLVELLPIPLDDNLRIVLGAGFAMYLLQ